MLFGALLHASWNALIKSGDDKALDTALIHFLGCAARRCRCCAGSACRSARRWPWLAASLVIHIGYYVTLVGAYRHGELGLAYPIMRGYAPLLVALLSGQLIGEHVPRRRVARHRRHQRRRRADRPDALGARDAARAARRSRFALANAAIIAAYTIVDGIGVRASGNALQYVRAAVPARRPARTSRSSSGSAARALRARSFAYMRGRWPVALLGACASLGAYGIALWAMTRAPVASVAALRETSVLFAALIGVFMLKERFGCSARSAPARSSAA